MLGENIRNNVAIAVDTLRANKLRSGLTILGVVMGVSTVMAMAAIVQGIKEQIVRTIEIAAGGGCARSLPAAGAATGRPAATLAAEARFCEAFEPIRPHNRMPVARARASVGRI